ncbi:MAG: D-2-hydroxyacid dehydrogenase [Azospirillaceae bacterium]
MTTPQQIPCPKRPEDLTVLINHDNYEPYLRELKQRFPNINFVVKDGFDGLSETLDEVQPDCVLSFRMGNKGPFPRELLLNHPSIAWLHATGAGIEHLPPWNAERMMVTNSSGLHVDIMAQYAVWAILNQSLRVPTYLDQQRRHEWRLYPVDSVRGKTAVIVGIGKVGRGIARQLKQLGMRVVGVRRHPDPVSEADITYTMDRLDDALGEADFVLLITPLTDETRGLFDAERLRKIKHGAHLINLARGNIVNEGAMIERIREGQLNGATIDVFANEPLSEDDPIWDAPNVIVTPHASGELENWQFHAAMVFADNLEHWLTGKDLANLCDPELGY